MTKAAKFTYLIAPEPGMRSAIIAITAQENVLTIYRNGIYTNWEYDNEERGRKRTNYRDTKDSGHVSKCLVQIRQQYGSSIGNRYIAFRPDKHPRKYHDLFHSTGKLEMPEQDFLHTHYDYLDGLGDSQLKLLLDNLSKCDAGEARPTLTGEIRQDILNKFAAFNKKVRAKELKDGENYVVSNSEFYNEYSTIPGAKSLTITQHFRCVKDENPYGKECVPGNPKTPNEVKDNYVEHKKKLTEAAAPQPKVETAAVAGNIDSLRASADELVSGTLQLAAGAVQLVNNAVSSALQLTRSAAIAVLTTTNIQQLTTGSVPQLVNQGALQSSSFWASPLKRCSALPRHAIANVKASHTFNKALVDERFLRASAELTFTKMGTSLSKQAIRCFGDFYTKGTTADQANMEKFLIDITNGDVSRDIGMKFNKHAMNSNAHLRHRQFMTLMALDLGEKAKNENTLRLTVY